MFLGIALVLAGYIVGQFAGGGIVLPLLWAWPKAARLHREGRLSRPISPFRFLIPAVVWIIIVAVTYLVVDYLLPHSDMYALGLGVAFFQNLKLVFIPNAHMEADFQESFLEPQV